ncbi:HNH endonuclease signature motif containing protein [Streptosporangium sp. NPDC002524]|uniref:HNH endonuclease n=1 Tax=Streptosporangium sp. NPDC002524 TaxID=3154537 RepID=UPI0033216080
MSRTSKGRPRHRPAFTRGEEGRQLRRRLAERDGSRCFFCWEPAEDPTSLTLDHYIPKCLWQASKLYNLVLACHGCNNAKGDTLPWPLVWLLLARFSAPDPASNAQTRACPRAGTTLAEAA